MKDKSGRCRRRERKEKGKIREKSREGCSEEGRGKKGTKEGKRKEENRKK